VEQLNETLTKTILEDGFSPPVASRIYAYSNIAAYEVLALLNDDHLSLGNFLNDWEAPDLSIDDKAISLELALVHAYCEVAKSMVYRDGMIDDLFNSLSDSLFINVPKGIRTASLQYGASIASSIIEWASLDNYKITRTLPIYTPNKELSSWQPTSPTYGEAAEPHWFKIRPFTLDNPDQFFKPYPVEFSTEKDSDFYKHAMKVYNTVNNLDSVQLSTARFWDCNPQMSKTRGHVMFKVRQITPGGHWIGITSIASRKVELSLIEAAYIHALVSVGIADGFISAWQAKYANDLIRPETYIIRHIDKDWLPILETPLFPEYPSAHSVISGAASTILENYFGENFIYVDDVEDEYGLGMRKFNSFADAADEVNISRIYGGIHYLFGVDDGLAQGREIGENIIEKLN